MTITPEEVARLAEAATPGPWRAFADETAAQVKGFPCIEADNYEVVGSEGMYGHYETDWANAAFIAAAHDMAALIAELKAERDALMEAMTTEPTDEMLASACMWHRHDFGLFDEERRREWLLVAREWWRASAKEMRHRAGLAKIKETPNG